MVVLSRDRSVVGSNERAGRRRGMGVRGSVSGASSRRFPGGAPPPQRRGSRVWGTLLGSGDRRRI